MIQSWGPAGRCVLAVALLAFGSVQARAQAQAQAPTRQVQALMQHQELRASQLPSWVTPAQAPLEQVMVAEQVRQGVHYLLADVQARVDGRQRQVYRHYAMKALNAKGVESVANIEVRFDPAYERLALHSIVVHRGGQRVERLAATELRVLQREKELDYLIFDGSKTAHAFLDDVRVGDVVEYAYTLTGSNPVFGDRFFGGFDLQWSSPVSRLHTRLLWPSGRPLHLKALNGAPAPRQRQLAGEEEYVWRQEAQAGLQPSPDAPSWYEPYAQVQWGDFGRWAEVAAWAQPLYRIPSPLSARLQAEVARIAALGSDPKLRTAEALRLVQREIRYLGVEVGMGSHAPNAPDLVFKRRFGDCKDKTLLTLSLLQALGVPARAALVHTQMKQSLAQVLPRPTAFNHVIVRAEIDGKPYWLDPTRASQPGPLDSIAQANFGLALVVDPASTGLSPMDPGPAMLSKRHVTVQLDARAGLNESALMTVSTELEGLSAEQMRLSLAAENAKELQQRYLNYYARSYPGISLEQDFEVQDAQPAGNRLKVVERYRVKDFFARVERERRLEASLEVPELLSLLQAPRDAIRNAPLALSHPQELHHELELLLPESWTFQDDVKEIQDPAFTLRREIRGGAQRLHISDRYRSLADHVLPEGTAAYAANVEKARKMLGYVVYKGDDNPTPSAEATLGGIAQSQLPLFAFAVLLLAVLGRGAQRLYAWDPAPAPSLAGTEGEALGGPLLLLALGLLINGVMIVQGAWSALPAYGMQTWNMFTVPGAERYHPAMAPLLLAELIAILVQLVGWILLALVYFKRRSSAVRIYLVYMWASVAIAVLDQWAIQQVPPLADKAESKEFMRQLMTAGILGLWTWYLLSSDRVRRTFVRRWPGRRPAAELPAAELALTPLS